MQVLTQAGKRKLTKNDTQRETQKPTATLNASPLPITHTHKHTSQRGGNHIHRETGRRAPTQSASLRLPLPIQGSAAHRVTDLHEA